MALQPGWALSLDSLRRTTGRRYLSRGGAGLFKSSAWFKPAFQRSSEQRFCGYFRVDHATYSALRLVLRKDMRSILYRQRGS